MEGDQCYELWIDDVDTITFHDNFDKEFFGKNVHLQNMCNLMSLDLAENTGEGIIEDDFDLEDYFFGDNSLPVENGTDQNETLKTRSVTPPSLKVNYTNTVQVDIGKYSLKLYRVRKSDFSKVFSFFVKNYDNLRLAF